MIMNAKSNAIFLVSVGALSASLCACGGNAQDPKTPEERVAADEAKLEDMEKEGVEDGSELDAEEIEQDEAEAKDEMADENEGESSAY